MATIWKRKDRDVWVADYRDATGKRIRLTAGTRPEAEGLLADKVLFSPWERFLHRRWGTQGK